MAGTPFGRWTVIALRSGETGMISVVAALPGVHGDEMVPGSVLDGRTPFAVTVAASTAADAARVVAQGGAGVREEPREAAVDGRRPSCRGWCDVGTPEGRLRDLLGHDRVGHRLANALAREDIKTLEQLRAADEEVLRGTRQIGWQSLERIRNAVGR